MESTNNKPYIKILIWLIIAGGILFVFQISLANRISFSNDRIDHILRGTSILVFLTTIVLVIITLLIFTKIKWQKIVLIVTVIPIGGALILAFAVSLFVSLVPNEVFARHYFYERDGFHYYVTSERYAAFEGSRELRYYKEKRLWFIIKQRLTVSEEELKKEGINPNEPSDQLWNLYRR